MTPEMMLAKMLSTTPAVVEKTASVEDRSEAEAMEKLAWAESLGRELAKEAAGLPAMGSMLQGARSMAGKGMLRTMQASTGTRALVGAGAGAAVGGVGGALKNPGVDPATGQQRSRLGNMAAGVAGGAALGAGAGLGARKALGAVATGKGAIGQSVRGTMEMGAKGARDIRTVKGINALSGEGRRAGLGAQARNRVAGTPKPPVAGAAPAAGAPAAPQMTGESARKAVDSQGMVQRGKQALGLSAVPDHVAQAKSYLNRL